MSSSNQAGILVLVLVQIWFEEREPPSGQAARAGAEPLPFVGWLGLLRVISELLAPKR